MISITFSPAPIIVPAPPEDTRAGAWLEFRGRVRGLEGGETIGGLRYEVYHAMAERQLRRIHDELAATHRISRVLFIHREGKVRVGETAVYVGVASPHRAEGLRYLEDFMNRLKQDVPIWKAEVLPTGEPQTSATEKQGIPAHSKDALISIETALRLIQERTPTLPPVTAPIRDCFGRVLREPIVAETDLPRTDRATMDGYAVRDDDTRSWRIARTASTNDSGVEHIAPGEAVRVSTGTSLRCAHPVRVLPVECVTCEANAIIATRIPSVAHIHLRGADARAGDRLITPGEPLAPGALALIASLGRASVRVAPRLSILHYTTGDELLPPGEMMRDGWIHDSNGPLVAGLLAATGESATHRHLSEDYAASLATVSADLTATQPDMLIISGGAGPGAGDFTGRLLRDLGYDILVGGGVNIRPGKPLIFGACASGAAFGLPGNPLSHWAAFHTFVVPALERLRGENTRRIKINATLTNAPGDMTDARPTNHPAHLYWKDGQACVRVHAWSASGNVRAAAEANAMVHLPANSTSPRPGDTVETTPLKTLPPLF